MAKTFHLVVFEVEHDGNLTPEELCQGLGMALDDLDMPIQALSIEGIVGNFKITNVLGVSEASQAMVNNLKRG